ncbi:MAG: class B sortase [Lachnospiraceae bacterium]|nr:class B sortase [Lachnospiraceae bacterium]
MKGNIQKIVRILISICLTGLVVFCGYRMVDAIVSEKKAAESYAELAAKVGATVRNDSTPETADTVEEGPIEVFYPDLQLDIAALEAMNGDFKGWLYFPALDISYPIVQGEDNSYYLKHAFDDEKLYAGCIFMDCGASDDWSDRNTFVFGHNMRDGSMFGGFKKLLDDTSLCEEQPYFYIYTEDWVYTYKIFSYYKTKSSSDRYMTFNTDETYDAYTEWAVENSLYTARMDLSDRPNIVSLSTCYGSAGTSRRIMIHGAMTAKEPYLHE